MGVKTSDIFAILKTNLKIFSVANQVARWELSWKKTECLKFHDTIPLKEQL
jgi:hypothetical protein